MDGEIITIIWLVAGIVMMLSELLFPGMVIGFLGVSSIIVAAARGLGLIDSLGASLGLWTVSSVGLVLGLRNMAMKYFPSEQQTVNIDEDTSMYGKEVQVVSDCDDNTVHGRIRVQGTTWPAKSVDGNIAAGSMAGLVYRDNVAWVIEGIEQAGQLPEGELENKVPALPPKTETTAEN